MRRGYPTTRLRHTRTDAFLINRHTIFDNGIGCILCQVLQLCRKERSTCALAAFPSVVNRRTVISILEESAVTEKEGES